MSIKIKVKSKVKFKINNDVSSEIPTDVIEEDTLDPELEKLEQELEQIKLAKQKLAIKKDGVDIDDDGNVKPAIRIKRKSQTVKKIDKESPSETLKKQHRPWVKEIGVKYSSDYEINIVHDIDRVDIRSRNVDEQGWSLCIVGISEDEIDATLFLKGKPDRMQPSICFLNIPDSKTEEIIDDLLSMRKGYLF